MASLLPCVIVLFIAGIYSAHGQSGNTSNGPESDFERQFIKNAEISDSESAVAHEEMNIPEIPQILGGDKMETVLKESSLIPVFFKGGPIMWPLLIASILAQGTVIERIIFLISERRKRDPKELNVFMDAVGQGDLQKAVRIGNISTYYVVRTLAYALANKQKSIENALLFAQEQELKRFRRGISILDTVITLAPLLGLLGTVTGMMGSFSMIGGELSAPGAITGGIAEALIATAFGLGIAITALIPFNLVNTKAEEARLEIESAATQLELLTHKPAKIKLAGA